VVFSVVTLSALVATGGARKMGKLFPLLPWLFAFSLLGYILAELLR
jgi:hypothetical protein